MTDYTIAVLPFVNISAGPDNEYFSDGITGEIINALAISEIGLAFWPIIKGRKTMI